MLCLSEVEAEDVRAVARRARTAVVPNAVAPRAPVERAAVEPPVLVALCRLDVRQKGLDRMAAIAAAAPALRLPVHGDRDRNEPAAVEHLLAHLPANLEVHEPVHGAAKEAALAGATAYVALSRWEGISMAVLEALAGGLPCIVSRYVARTLGDEAGTAVAVLDDRLLDDDPAAAGRAIEALVADPEALRARAAHGRELASARFAPAAVADALEAAYRAGLAAAKEER